MIKMINWFKLQNLEDELEKLETKILKNNKLTRIDLQELEGLSNKIQWLRYEMGQN